MKFLASKGSKVVRLQPKITPDKWTTNASLSSGELSIFLRIVASPITLTDSFTGDASTVIELDRVFSDRTATKTYKTYQLHFEHNIPSSNITFSWSSAPSSVANLLPNGVLEYVSDGVVIVSCSVDGSFIRDDRAFEITSSLTDPVREFVNFVDDSLAQHCCDSIDSRIVNAQSVAKGIYSIQNHANSTYVRNPNCWIFNMSQQATCISPWNSAGGNTRAGTLITKRHILFAAHYEIPENHIIRFVTADNQVVERTIVARKRIPGYYAPIAFPDLTVGVLDSDLPPSITPCKVLPDNYSDYFPTGVKNIPALGLDQEEKAIIADLSSLTNTYAGFAPPTNINRQVFYEDKIVGDSGNPAFLIINGQFVLLTVWSFGGAGSGTFVTPQIATINQMIVDADTLAGNGGTGYTLQTVDLSGFTNFV